MYVFIFVRSFDGFVIFCVVWLYIVILIIDLGEKE